MREMKDSGVEWIGEIPEDWKILRFRYFISDYKSGPFGSSLKIDGLLPEGNILVYTPEHISHNSMDIENNLYLPEYRLQEMDQFLVKTGDILFPIVGSLGRSMVITNEMPMGIINQRLAKFRIDTNVITLRFFMWLFSKSEFFMPYIETVCRGSFIVNLTKGIMNDMPCVIPPLWEQHRISNYLDNKCTKIDLIIMKQHSIIEKLKEYKLSFITESVIRGLNHECQMKDSGIDYIGLIPAHWHQCRLRNIGGAQNGISKGAEYFGEGFPFVSYGDVYRNYSLPYEVQGRVRTTAEEQEHYSVEAGDIFFTRTSETIDEVGFSCVCEKTIPRATYAGFVIRVRPYSNVLYTGYAKYYFRSSHHRSYLAKEMNLVTRASLGQDLLKSMPVLVPPKEEQKVIASFLDEKCDEIDYIISQKESLISKLIDYKKSMVYEAVTGKREVL